MPRQNEEPAPITNEQFSQLIAALTAQAQTQRPLDADTLKQIMTETATISAQSMQKALKPENTDHPGVSAFSHPKGEKDHPKPALPYELFWNGYPMHKFPETETWREWELSAQLTPGEFTVLRKDGSLMAITIRAERDAEGTPTKLWVEFPISRAEQWLIPPKLAVLYQLIHTDNPRLRFMEAMNEYFAAMVGQPVAV